MRRIIRQLFEAQTVPQVIVAGQGSEPTLMGLDFFKRSLEFQKKYAKPGTRIENTFQTNGILLDDEWCRYFHKNNFLIGLSLDGHDRFFQYFLYQLPIWYRYSVMKKFEIPVFRISVSNTKKSMRSYQL